jgi:hypothetical protein
MPQEMTVAMKTAKEIEKNLTVAENRLAYVQEECKRFAATKENLQGEVDKKVADYNMYVAAKDAETKKLRQDVFQEREQMEKDKVEFQSILQKFKLEQNALASAKEEFDNDKRKTGAQVDNIRQFIIAVQRASSLLGL